MAALLAESQKMPLLKNNRADSEGWTKHKSRKMVKREHMLENEVPKKQKKIQLTTHLN